MGKWDILIPQNYLSEIHLGILYLYLWNLATLPKCNSVPLIPTFHISCEFHAEANSKKETCSEGDFDKCSFLPCKGQWCQIDNKRFGMRYHEAILALEKQQQQLPQQKGDLTDIGFVYLFVCVFPRHLFTLLLVHHFFFGELPPPPEPPSTLLPPAQVLRVGLNSQV